MILPALIIDSARAAGSRHPAERGGDGDRAADDSRDDGRAGVGR